MKKDFLHFILGLMCAMILNLMLQTTIYYAHDKLFFNSKRCHEKHI